MTRMHYKRWFGALLTVVVFHAVSLAEEKYLLKNETKVGAGWQVDLEMKLTGLIKIKDGEKTTSLNLKAGAKHRFEERVLTVQDGKPASVGRFYQEAKADISLQGKTITKTLRPERRFQVAFLSTDHGATTTYSPDGPLTDDELDLTGDHLDVLALHGVLPNKEVAVGETWDVPLPVAQALAGLDGVISSKLQCKLEKIERNHAVLALTGEIQGIVKGATLKSDLAVGLVYSLDAKHFTGCSWRHKEVKEQGPVNPASEVETEITANWRHGIALTEMTDGKVATIPAQPSPGLLLLEFRDAVNRFSFLYERKWGIINKSEKQTVLRLLEQGELIAQLNISPYSAAKPGQHVNLEEVEKLVGEAAGFKLDKVLEKTEVPAAAGFWIGKVSATGEASELPMQQIVFAVAGPRGDQALLSFTVETEHAEKLAGRDLSLVKTFSLPTIQPTGAK